MIEVLGWLAWVIGHITQPSVISCARGYWLEGVRPNGVTRCIKDDFVDPSKECKREGDPCGPWPDAPWYPVRVWCKGGSAPSAVDDKLARCL